MNLEKFEYCLCLYGSNIKNWGDKSLANEAILKSDSKT